MHLNLEMKNMTLSSKVTNRKTSFLGNNEEKNELNLNGMGSITCINALS